MKIPPAIPIRHKAANFWAGASNLLTTVVNDHITRRTYRVWIVAAKIPQRIKVLPICRKPERPRMITSLSGPWQVPTTSGTAWRRSAFPSAIALPSTR